MNDSTVQAFALDQISSITLPQEESDIISAQNTLSRLFDVFSERYSQVNAGQCAKEKNARVSIGTPRQSFFQRIFGTKNNSSSTSSSIDNIEEHTYLEESTHISDDENGPKESKHGEDWSNIRIVDQIQPEAHCSARFFLSSIKSRTGPQMSFRPCTSHGEKPDGNLCVITDFGMIAEFDVSDPNNNSLLATFDDRDALIRRKTQESFHSPLRMGKESIRCCQISSNCVAISWGFQDGIVVVYRKVQLVDGTTIGWKGVNLISPLEDAIRCVQNLLPNTHEKDNAFTSGLLRVSEVCSIQTAKRKGTGQDTYLCISRVGGFLELISIPEKISRDPLIMTQKHPKAKAIYTDELSDLSSIPSVRHVGISTTSIHSDITAMTVQKIQSTQEPSGLDFVIYTAGYSCNNTDSNHNECLGVWGVSSDDEETVRLISISRHEFSNLGPQVTIIPSTSAITDSVPKGRNNRKTYSIDSPISAVRAIFEEGKGYFIVILDYNGGVTIINAPKSFVSSREEHDCVSSFSLVSSRFETFDQGVQDVAIWRGFSREPYIIIHSDDNRISISKLSSADRKADLETIASLSFQPNQGVALLNGIIDESLFFTKIESYESSILSLEKVYCMQLSQHISSLVSKTGFIDALMITRHLKDSQATQEALDSYLFNRWKENCEVSVLLQVSDKYSIVKEILQLENDEKILCRLSLDDLSFLFKETIKSFKPTRLNCSHLIHQLEAYLLRIGTFILIQPFMKNCVFSSRIFYSRFLRLNLTEFVMQLALEGKVSAICLVLVRHWHEFEQEDLFLKIMERIPWLISYESYKIFILLATTEPLYQRGVMLSFLESARIIPYMNTDDSVIVEKAVSEKKYKNGGTLFSASAWCVQRAKKLITFFKDFNGAIDLLTGALGMLEASEQPKDTLSTILCLRASIYHIKNMIDSVMHFDSDFITWLETLSVDDFQSIGVYDIVSIVLRDCYDSNEIFFRIRSILSPMFCGKQEYDIPPWHDSLSIDEKLEVVRRNKFEVAVVQFYLEQLSLEMESMISLNHVPRILSCCRHITKLSASCLSVPERIISDDTFLMQFVIDTSKILLPRMSPLILGQLWEMYECLPCRNKSCDLVDSALNVLSHSVDSIYRSLVASQFLFKWNSQAFTSFDIESFFNLHDKAWTNVGLESCKADLVEMGGHLINVLSNGFVKCAKAIDMNDINDFVLSFISDIHEFNELCFLEFLSLKENLDAALIFPLLQREHFAILRKLVLTDSISELSLQKEVLFWCREVVSDRNLSHSKKLSMILQSLHSISHSSPVAFKALTDAKKYLDAIGFIPDSLGYDSFPSFDLFQSESPIDVLESIVEACPNILTIDCPEWNDHSFAERKMEEIRYHIERNDPDTSFPLLPGDRIQRLAKLMGFNEPKRLFFVKSRLIQWTHQAGLHAAAGSLCAILLHYTIEEYNVLLDVHTYIALLSSIFNCLSLDSCLSISMKQFIFQKSLILFKANIHHDNEGSRILAAFLLTEFIDPLDYDDRCVLASSIKNIYSHLPNHMKETGFIWSSSGINSVKDLQKLVSDKIIPWCSSALSNSLTTDAIMDIVVTSLRTTIPLLLSVHMTSRCYEALQSCLFSIRTMKGKYLDSDVNISLQILKPNEHIVKQLIQMGYSVNGARRSAIQTDNESVSAALSWAVAHEPDSNFDSQLIFLEKKSVKFETKDLLEDLLSTEILLNLVLEHFSRRRNEISSGLVQKAHFIGAHMKKNRLVRKNQTDSEEPKSQSVRTNQLTSQTVTYSDETNIDSKIPHEKRETESAIDSSDAIKSALIQNGKKIVEKNQNRQLNQMKLQLAIIGKSILQKSRKEIDSSETKRNSLQHTHESTKKSIQVHPTTIVENEKARTLAEAAAEAQRLKEEEEAEAARLAAEEEAQRLKKEVEAEAARHAAKEEARRLAEAAEEGARRLKEEEEAEAVRLAAEEEARRLAEAAAEAQRLKEEVEAEAARLAAEEEARRLAEAAAEAQRLKEEEEAEAARLAAEEEAQRLKKEVEAEAARHAAREEARRLAEAAAEAQRLKKKEEAEAARLAAEEEARRLKEEADATRLASFAQTSIRSDEVEQDELLTRHDGDDSIGSILSNDACLDTVDGWGFDCSMNSVRSSDSNASLDGWDDDLDLLDI